jgi:hypothetical protein
MEFGAMLSNAIIAALIVIVAYLLGVLPTTCFAVGGAIFLLFSYNEARAEVAELKLILDQEAPGWRERNAIWTSTWDWNRELKRLMKRRDKQDKKRRAKTNQHTSTTRRPSV